MFLCRETFASKGIRIRVEGVGLSGTRELPGESCWEGVGSVCGEEGSGWVFEGLEGSMLRGVGDCAAPWVARREGGLGGGTGRLGSWGDGERGRLAMVRQGQ